MKRAQTIEIPVADEGFALEGRLEGREGGPGALLCHPHPAFGGHMDVEVVAALAEALRASGFRVLRFNFRGVGQSGGRGEGGLVEERDVMAAAAALRERQPGEIAIAGYSFGALMAAKALARGERARRFAALGFPTALVDHTPERVAEIRSAMRRTRSLFVSGTRDQFSDVDRLKDWSRDSEVASVESLADVDHFPGGGVLSDVARRIAEFLGG